ncbi:MAG: hypothetical protein ACPGU1_13595 [Myxococcota bacterium]
MLSRTFILPFACLCVVACGASEDVAPSTDAGASSGDSDATQGGANNDSVTARPMDTTAPVDSTSSAPDTAGPAPDGQGATDAPAPTDTDETTAPDPQDTEAPSDSFSAGDGSAPEDVPPPPLEPTLIQANTTWEVTAEMLLEGDYTYAWDPAGKELIVQDDEGAVYMSIPGQVSAPLDVTAGGLHSGALVPDGNNAPLLLVAAEEGLFIHFDETLVLSPLDALLPSAPHALLVSGPPAEGWLWLAMAEGLWVFHDGAVYTVAPEGVETTDAAMTFGAPVNGVDSLWGVNGSGTWALSPVGDVLNLSATRSELTGTAIAADSEEHLWVVDDQGDLHERAPDGAWSWWRLPEAVVDVAAAAKLGGIWLTVGDALWFHYGEGYGPLETVVDGTFLGVDSEGRALVASEGQLWALAVDDVTSVVIEDPPTWSADVTPIFIASCEPCHGKGAYAHPLFEPEQWIAEIEEIVFMVTEPAWEPQMPLAPYPPLDNEAVQVIMDWRDAGFPE